MTHSTRDAEAQHTDAALVRDIGSGHYDALQGLNVRYAARLGAYIIRVAGYTIAPEDVEELVANCFVTAWRKAASYNPARGPVEAWLLHMARYEALTFRRRRYVAPALTDEDDLADLADPAAADGDMLVDTLAARENTARLLSTLTETERTIIRQRYLENRPLQEIADDLGLSAGALGVRLHRLRRRLRREWEQLKM